ncbi:MAG: hypothetical protein HZB62_10660 [Nitrospirae bacterium]|nr:hypothetical protein [Nitrospirota bacterium]
MALRIRTLRKFQQQAKAETRLGGSHRDAVPDEGHMKDFEGKQIVIDFEQLASGHATDMTHAETFILHLIQRGKANAIKVPVLEAATNLQGVEVRETIRHLIMEHGVLIASCTHGFFIAETAEEITEATRSLRHRGIMILMRAAKLQKISIEEIFNQTVFEFTTEVKK